MRLRKDELRIMSQALFRNSWATEPNYCEVDRVGYSMMVVKDLIQFEEFQRVDFHQLPSTGFKKIDWDMLFIINLILNGISKECLLNK